MVAVVWAVGGYAARRSDTRPPCWCVVSWGPGVSTRDGPTTHHHLSFSKPQLFYKQLTKTRQDNFLWMTKNLEHFGGIRMLRAALGWCVGPGGAAQRFKPSARRRYALPAPARHMHTAPPLSYGHRAPLPPQSRPGGGTGLRGGEGKLRATLGGRGATSARPLADQDDAI